jgi:hypothetical protein
MENVGDKQIYKTCINITNIRVSAFWVVVTLSSQGRVRRATKNALQ